MKILGVNKFFFEKRGAERHFFDLCRLLEQHGNTVAVLAMEHPENQSSPWAKYFVSRVGYNRGDATFWEKLLGIGRLFWSYEARTKMRALLCDFTPDIVHVHNAYHQLSLSFFPLIREVGVPLILTAHDYAAISPDKDAYYPEVGRQYWKFLFVRKYSFGKRLLLVLKKYWEDWMGFYSLVDRFIVPSEFVARTFEAAGIKQEKIVVLPHFLVSDRPAPLAPHAVVLPERFMLSFGAITEGKGINEAIGIAERLRIPLVLAGKKDGKFVLQSGPMTTYIGPRSQGELRFLIEKAECVINASTLPETFGLTALETIALGKPFLTLASGALPEIIHQGENGFVARDIHELEMLVSDFLAGKIRIDSPETIAQKAKDTYSAERYAERFESLVKEIQ